MFLPCEFNTKDREKGWINTDFIIDAFLTDNDDEVIAYTADDERCSYIINLEIWQAFLLSFVEVEKETE